MELVQKHGFGAGCRFINTVSCVWETIPCHYCYYKPELIWNMGAFTLQAECFWLTCSCYPGFQSMVVINDQGNLMSQCRPLPWAPCTHCCYSNNMGKIIYQVKVIEYQKRGLPHAHTDLKVVTIYFTLLCRLIYLTDCELHRYIPSYPFKWLTLSSKLNGLRPKRIRLRKSMFWCIICTVAINIRTKPTTAIKTGSVCMVSLSLSNRLQR